MSVLITSFAVLAACLVLAWGLTIRSQIRAKGLYVNFFSNAATEFIDTPEFADPLKQFLADIAGFLQNKKFANHVAKGITEGDVKKVDIEVLQLMNNAEHNPTEEQSKFLFTIHFFLMAMSYSSYRYGSKLRLRFRGELNDRKALMEEVSRASEATKYVWGQIAPA